MIEYTIEIHDFGILIRNPIPADDIKIIVILGQNYGCQIFDALLSQHFGASFCLISKKKSKEMREKLGLE